MNNDKTVAIGVLAFNEQDFIEEVLNNLLTLNVHVYVINDGSTDSTMNILKRFETNPLITIIDNPKNMGAGNSTLKILKEIRKNNYYYMLKIDGDNQFKLEDVKKILALLQTKKYDFIKSNRFWSKGIEGAIPQKRYLGNLLATILLQIVSGTNKIYDPLNGLFAIKVEILDIINERIYPKRYGYPFYFSAISVISFYRIYQINNVVTYGAEKSSLSSFKMVFTLSRLITYFYILKIKKKLLIGKYQRSAFLDILSVSFLFISLLTLLRFFLIFLPINFFDTSNIGSWALISLVLVLFNVLIFVEAFKEEKAARDRFIENEDLIE